MNDIYTFVKEQETAYSKPIDLDGWSWSMKDHLRRCFLYKNSQFEEENDNRDLRPNKNIILGILNVQYRTEGFDVKDIDIYVDDKDEYYKSFLARKFHVKWAPENQIDTFIDDMVESYADYGGVLVRNTNQARPSVIDLKSLAFCNQTNILAYPFCIKHSLSPSQLREMGDELGWGGEGATIGIEDLITLCKDEKEIIVYEFHGTVSSEWLKNEPEETKKKDIRQIQVIAYYQDQNKQAVGVCLFKKKMPKLPFKFLPRDPIKGRALGRGGIEELIEPQKWTNWDEIKVTEMLEAASKVIGWTDDPTLSAKHPTGMKNMDNLEFLELKPGSRVGVVDNYPRNLTLFNDSLDRWQAHAQVLGSAGEGLLSQDTPSGMPFKLYEAKNIEDKSMHRYRQGKIATFMDEIYRDWILPHFSREIVRDHKFLAELSVDELQEIAGTLADKEHNRLIKNKILKGPLKSFVEIEELKMAAEQLRTFTQENFLKKGAKRFVEMIKDEMKNLHFGVMTNIAGKQKNLALLTDKLVNVLRQYIATPQIRQDPEMTKLLNTILESSGLSPIMFGPRTAPVAGGRGSEPLEQLSQNQLSQANAA